MHDRSESPCITSALRAASRRLTQIYDEALAPSGLRVTQYHILSELERRLADPPTVGELAEAIVMDRSALGQTLRPLERDGFVLAGSDPADRRRRPLVLTADGQRALAGARMRWREAHRRFETYFGAGELAGLRETLRALATDPALAEAFGPDPAEA